MKRFLTVLMSLVMVVGLAGCSSQTTSNTSSNSSSAAESSESQTESESSSSSDANTLVVYFSATGNTEQAANYIADLTGGDLFELEPADPYTSDDLNWTDENSRVVREHDNPDQREVELVEDTVDNWDSYDTVYLGYPKMEQGYICV